MYNYLLISVFVILGIYVALNYKKLLTSDKNDDPVDVKTSPKEEPVSLLTDSVGVVEQVKEVKVKKAKKTSKKKVSKKKTPRRRDL